MLPSFSALSSFAGRAGAQCITTRPSHRAQSGVVAQVVFSSHALAGKFARLCAARLGFSCVVRRVSGVPAFYVSVPVFVGPVRG